MPSSTLDSGLAGLRERVYQGAAAGLDDAAQAMQATAQATTAYHGVTGATRAGTVAFVVGAGVESGGVFNEAVAAVRDANPDHVDTSGGGTIGDNELAIVLTVPTDYQVKLEIENAGARAFLGDALNAHAPEATAAAARGIAGVLR